MKKAVLYARVSSSRQEKEKTIASQISELKKQIQDNGDSLVKEYIDNGYSGALLDRPALNELRQDLKSDLFDTIYFLNTDRIAREVTYQTIIIAEILRYKKQIIINGKDYVNNPENKFTLTILGAVSELERAKIIERSLRGKLYKLKQGQLLNNGSNMYGYRYIKKSRLSPAKLVINPTEAKVIKYLFSSYAKGLSWSKLIHYLEDKGIKTKNGQKLWNIPKLKSILENHTYYGLKHFNRIKHDKTDGGISKYGRKVIKDKAEWISIKVPAIIPKSLFDKVQLRLKNNTKVYRRKPETQLLSGLIVCGNCQRRFIAYQRYYRYRTKTANKVVHKVAYVCGRRAKNVMHSKKLTKDLCKNPEISARVIEPAVWQMITDTLLNPDKLLLCTDYVKDRVNKKLEKQINVIDNNILDLTNEKKQCLDRYAKGKITRTQYSKKSQQTDNEIEKLKNKKDKLIKSVPALHKKYMIEISVKQFCEIAKTRFEQANDFETKRQFLLDYIDKIIYLNKELTLSGLIFVDGVNKIKFYIKNEI